MERREFLKAAFQTDGRSCRDVISDRQYLDVIQQKRSEAEQLIKQAEEMRKKGLALLKESEAEEKKEKAIQQAIREFIGSDADFIAENGEQTVIIRLREGEKSGRKFIIIRGERSEKLFHIFLPA